MDKKRFNIIDLIIALVIVAVVFAGAYAVKLMSADGNTETKVITLEIKQQKESFCKVVKKDDVAYDGTTNTKLGKVVDFKIQPAESDCRSTKDGTIKKSVIPERYDIYIDIETPKDTDVQVGKQMWIETSVYKAGGYILGVKQ